MMRFEREAILSLPLAEAIRITLWLMLAAALLLLATSCDKDGPVEVTYETGGVSLEFVLPEDAPTIQGSISAWVRVTPHRMAAWEEELIITDRHANRPIEVPVGVPCVITVTLDYEGVMYRGSVATPALNPGSFYTAGIQMLEPGDEPAFSILTPDTVAAGREISLALYGEGAHKMRIGNAMALPDSVASDSLIPDSILADTVDWGAGWVAYDSLPDWTLTTGADAKIVYAQIAYLNGDTSAVVSDTIGIAALNGTAEIANGAETTASKDVVVRLSSNYATEMKVVAVGGDTTMMLTGKRGSTRTVASDSIEWIPFEDRVRVELPDGPGEKWVEILLRDEFLVEYTVRDTIATAEIEGSVAFAAEGMFVNELSQVVTIDASGASRMAVSVSGDSTNLTWRTLADQHTVGFSPHDGWRTVYVWLQNDFTQFGPLTDSIGIDRSAAIDSFAWSASTLNNIAPGDTLYFSLWADSAFYGPETHGSAYVTVAGLPDTIDLAEEGAGVYSAYYPIYNTTPQLDSAAVTAYFTDRAGNVAEPVVADSLVSGGGLTTGTVRSFELGNTGNNIQMVWIAPGSYEMGALPNEAGADLDETPRHTVTFRYGFWIARTELTQSQWEAVMGSGNVFPEFPGPSRPVETVSFNEAQLMISVINSSEMESVWRLPTEAEWEYAARAGSTERFPWGTDTGYNQLGGYAWFNGNSSNTTHNVGGREANPWGLEDMFGNVWEWCLDWHHDSYTGAPDDGSPWLSPSGSERVIRGGSWNDPGGELRSASRGSADPDSRSSSIGFRLVRMER